MATMSPDRRSHVQPMRQAPGLNASSADLPRMRRQRCRFSRDIVGSALQIAEIDFVEILQRLLFLFTERLDDLVECLLFIQAPEMGEVLANLPLFARAEDAERPAQEDQCTLELIGVQRFDVGRECLPKSLASEQRIAIALGEPLEPARPEIRR